MRKKSISFDISIRQKKINQDFSIVQKHLILIICNLTKVEKMWAHEVKCGLNLLNY